MEILVLSDSHGRVDHMVRAVEQFHPGRCCIWGLRPGRSGAGAAIPQLPVTMVPGNCDWGQTGEPERLLEIEGVRILMLHGHTRHVKSSPWLLSTPPGVRGRRAAVRPHPRPSGGLRRRPVGDESRRRRGLHPSHLWSSHHPGGIVTCSVQNISLGR